MKKIPLSDTLYFRSLPNDTFNILLILLYRSVNPPDLPVTLGDTQLGKTPSFLKKVKPRIHTWILHESEAFIGKASNPSSALFQGQKFFQYSDIQ